MATGWVSTTMDTWSVEQTKASFLGITAHWIHIGEMAGIAKWSLQSRVIGFCSLSGPHTGENIINNDLACDSIEQALQKWHIYTFDPTLHRLPCLVHVLNLTITKFTSVETTMAIWEFNLSLPSSRILGDLLDVVAAIRTITIKIQCSGQPIEYFHMLQNNCSINSPLSIPLHSNV
ncbi:hypothetical protein SCLCIDRAFT_68622, partial [Scleroderma citrinum Foug A]